MAILKTPERLKPEAVSEDTAIRILSIRGAREHNLKNVNLDIPRDSLTVITGVSGSGKSTLAFDTLYAEGQRRYVESLSAYARQFLEQLTKPEVDSIEGLSPAISIDQKSASRNPRSTVGTVTEIYDFLRLLYARIGTPHCPKCGSEIAPQNLQHLLEKILGFSEGATLNIFAPLVIGRKGIYQKELEELRQEGFTRVRIDGEMMDLVDDIQLDRQKKHTIEVFIDRLQVKQGIEERLSESLEMAGELTDGRIRVEVREEAGDRKIFDFNEQFACMKCGESFPEMEPRLFSFNSPYGACSQCNGLGVERTLIPELFIVDDSKSLREGAVAVVEERFREIFQQIFLALANHYEVSPDKPFHKLPKEFHRALFYGTGEDEIHYPSRGSQKGAKKPFEGLLAYWQRRYEKSERPVLREIIEQYMAVKDCPACEGKRLRKEALCVTLDDLSIDQIVALPIRDALHAITAFRLNARQRKIGERVLKEIQDRLRFLLDVGLDYLSLDRGVVTLSGGESQRIRLAGQIGSGMVGVLYILDEPSMGLHASDNQKLLRTLAKLRDSGNTVLVVEHDEETIRAADFVVDMGPGAGVHGGEVVVAGTLDEVMKNPHSLTGKFLSGKERIEIPKKRRKAERVLQIRGAKANNLKNISVDIPLGVFVCVTGVSGSGKSTLVQDTLDPWFRSRLYQSRVEIGAVEAILGANLIDKVIAIDQLPIGRTPRSNPATYAGVFSLIRELFAELPEARMRGWKSGRFSFNVKGGRCESCQGAGLKKIEMHFLPDIFVQCENCGGKRYGQETLEVKYRDASIADILSMTISEALHLLQNIPAIKHKLSILEEVGLGYLSLGQSATSLSGGEAQRLKLARELSRRSTGKTLYILDEPTTGLHFADIRQLLEIFQRLVDQGNTVLVIEHNLDVIKSADFILDLGPGAGDEGGRVVASGTPEEVARVKGSATGQCLLQVLSFFT